MCGPGARSTGDVSVAAALRPDDRAGLRGIGRESRTIALGVQHSACWHYGDGTLQSLDREQLIYDAVAAIRDFHPDIVFSFGPDGGYGHPDHIVMCQVAEEAVRRAGDPTQFPEQVAAGLAPHQPWRYFDGATAMPAR